MYVIQLLLVKLVIIKILAFPALTKCTYLIQFVLYAAIRPKIAKFAIIVADVLAALMATMDQYSVASVLMVAKPARQPPDVLPVYQGT